MTFNFRLAGGIDLVEGVMIQRNVLKGQATSVGETGAGDSWAVKTPRAEQIQMRWSIFW